MYQTIGKNKCDMICVCKLYEYGKIFSTTPLVASQEPSLVLDIILYVSTTIHNWECFLYVMLLLIYTITSNFQ